MTDRNTHATRTLRDRIASWPPLTPLQFTIWTAIGAVGGAVLWSSLGFEVTVWDVLSTILWVGWSMLGVYVGAVKR